MRRLLTIAAFVVTVLSLTATTYTPAQVPNVQIADSTQYVSNPDGILSADAVADINSSLRSLRHNTTVEAVVVALDNIEGGDPDQFATELFELWQPGKSDLDNGLLLLIVKDLRKVTIRPGYGLEGVLPDITCGQIIRQIMAPEFRRNDFNTGTVAAVNAICNILTDPENTPEIFSKERDVNTTSEGADIFHTYLIFACCMAGALLLWLIVMLVQTRGKDRHERFVSMVRYRPIFLACTFLGLGIPIIASLPMVILLQYWRNSPRICSRCGKKMNKLDEATDNNYLDPGQDLEEQLGSVDYDVWLCPDCGETDIEAYVNNSSGYRICPRCGVRAYSLRNNRVLRQPTTRQEGLGVRQYHCRACGYDHDENYNIPRKTDDSALLAGAILGAAAGSRRSGGFGGGGFGGGFGGGGFGGGSTGGGGATGGW